MELRLRAGSEAIMKPHILTVLSNLLLAASLGIPLNRAAAASGLQGSVVGWGLMSRSAWESWPKVGQRRCRFFGVLL